MATETLTTETRAYTVTTERGHNPILLQPRRYARFAGLIVLVPLLPQHAPLKPLPAEVWRRILMLAMSMDEEDCLDNQGIVSSSHSASEFINISGKGKHVQRWSKWDLALVCKELKVRTTFNTCRLCKNLACTIHNSFID